MVKVMEHNIRNGDIQMQISKSIKATARFCASLAISEVSAFQFWSLKIYVNVMEKNIRNDAIR